MSRSHGFYRHVSVIRLTMDDPVNEDLNEGDVLLRAGRCEDGVSHTVLSEQTKSFLDVECEVLGRLETESKMTEREIEQWAAGQERVKDLAKTDSETE